MQEGIGYNLVQVAKAHRGRIAAALAELGLHVGQDLLLLQLWRREGATQSALAERLGVTPPTLTKMVKRMERAGLLERRPDPDDARVSRVYLTERGRGVEAQVRAAWRRVEEQMLEDIPAEEQKHLRHLLQQMRRNLESSRT